MAVGCILQTVEKNCHNFAKIGKHAFLRNLRYLKIYSSYSNLIYTKRTEIYSGFHRTLQIQATTFENGDMNRQTFDNNYETDLNRLLKTSATFQTYLPRDWKEKNNHRN